MTAPSQGGGNTGDGRAAEQTAPMAGGLAGYRMRELAPVLVSVVLGVFILIQAQNIQSGSGEIGARFWPMMLGMGMIGLGAILVVTNVVRAVRPSDIPDRISAWGVTRIVGAGAVLIGYLLLWRVLQFWLITIVAVFLLSLLFDRRGWKALVAFPIIIGFILHLLFIVLLKVPL
ncbi:tripartite tricarboxylate transporter TctB family protein [Micrococcoides hystricis]|uniref:Tripartite tricarboxylate transporter TctB family protein n=1 Tax=Micrococcoides hystricis TaxID=1572761 RepID=A0ABV6PCF5_9MICC